ncbi:MAG: redoxin domain-containing protein [Anaerolineales bacterium]|nr:redoxin domain-containing protein [Anaerolineales bacterium]
MMNLRRDRSEILPALRWLGFTLAIVAGFALWWRFLLSPQSFPVPNPTQTPTQQPIRSSPEPSVPVPSTGTSSGSLGLAVRVGSLAPDFTLPDLEKGPLSLNMFQGSVVLINFWTTWCPPCRAEMPALQEAYEKYQDQGFTVLAVNWTQVDDPEQVEPFVREFGLTFPILLDENGEVSERLYNLLGLPTSVFIGRDGMVREIFIGPLQLESLEARIQSLLEEPV